MSQKLAFTFFGARIDFFEQHNGKFFTVITMPAPDAFSHPSRYKLSSDRVIGQQGMVMDVQVELSGMVRQRNYFDKQTGQQKSFQEADVYLNAVGWQPSQQAQQPAADGKK